MFVIELLGLAKYDGLRYEIPNLAQEVRLPVLDQSSLRKALTAEVVDEERLSVFEYVFVKSHYKPMDNIWVYKLDMDRTLDSGV